MGYRKKIGALLRKLHLYNIVHKPIDIYRRLKYKVRKKAIEKQNDAKAAQVAEQANRLIEELRNKEDGREIVYIFQQTYYTADGERYISGGGERYASDLSDLIFELGYQPVLVQFGVPEAEELWSLKRNHLYVIGLNIDWGLYPRTIHRLREPKLAIYSGYTNFGEKYFSPNIVISHGITWDAPYRDADTEYLKSILCKAERLVSVDTNTISYMRSSFSKMLSEQHIDMQFVPNYTDIYKYVPDVSARDPNSVRVIFPRRCSAERGFWLIAKILPPMLDKYSNMCFDFVGFIHTEEVGAVIEELKNAYPGRVNHFLVDADEMYKVYQRADISLIPTLYCEGTSLSCIEAMACGNVVISTNIGGLPNLIIDGYNGRLINPDETELLDALDEILGDCERRKIMEKRAVEVAKAFSKEKWEDKWRKILSDSLRRKFVNEDVES